MTKPIIEAIKEYFETCPALGDDKFIHVDFLDTEVGGYSIDPTPANPVVRRFVDGSREMQCLFTFATRRFYSTDTNRANIDSLQLFESITSWLDDNNEKDIFPDIDGEGIAVVVLSGGYLMGANDGKQTARYQMQCKFNYIERKD